MRGFVPGCSSKDIARLVQTEQSCPCSAAGEKKTKQRQGYGQSAVVTKGYAFRLEFGARGTGLDTTDGNLRLQK